MLGGTVFYTVINILRFIQLLNTVVPDEAL